MLKGLMARTSRTQHAGSTVLTALAPASWGTTYVVTTQLLPAGYPLYSTVLRVLPAAVILLLITRVRPTGDWWWRVLVLGALNIGAFTVLLFVAAYRLPGGVAATLTSLQPLIVTVLVFPLLGEKPTRWRLAWGAAGVVGVALIVIRPGAAFDPVGVVSGIAAAAAMATGIVLTRKWGRPPGAGAITMAGWQLAAGALVVLPLAIISEGGLPPLTPGAIGGYLWLCTVGAALSYPLWFNGIGRLPVTAVSFLGLLSPVVATALGATLLGESLTALQGLGFAIALAAIVAAQLPPRTRHTHPQSAHQPTEPE